MEKFQRTPRYRYKVRKTTCGNESGENYSLTVPRVVAKQFNDVWFYMSITNDSIIFQSGCSVMSNGTKT